MAITYPLTLPSTPKFKRFQMRGRNVVGMTTSTFTGEQQTQQHQGEWWEADCVLPPMVRADAEAWLAFLLSLRGHSGTFPLGDPGGETARGVATGNPQVDGAGQTGTVLNTLGWTASQTGIMLAGDYLQIAKNYLTFPKAVDNAAWTKTACSVTGTDTIVAPDGTTTAERITPDGGATNALFYQQNATPSVIPSRTFYGGMWLKAASGTPSINIYLTGGAAGVGTGQNINLTTSWQFATVSRLLPSTATAVGLEIGGGNTWPEADGAIDVWGAATWSVEQDARLHKNLTERDSNSNRLATFNIWPRLRESPPDASKIIVASPVGLFRLMENVAQWDLDEIIHYGVGFRALEAF